MPDYSRYFTQDLLSDCDLVISWHEEDGLSPASEDVSEDTPCAAAAAAHEAADKFPPVSTNRNSEVLCTSVSLPAHQIVLFTSRHFEAQVGLVLWPDH